MTALAGVELESLVSEPDALTTRHHHFFLAFAKCNENLIIGDCFTTMELSVRLAVSVLIRHNCLIMFCEPVLFLLFHPSTVFDVFVQLLHNFEKPSTFSNLVGYTNCA